MQSCIVSIFVRARFNSSNATTPFVTSARTAGYAPPAGAAPPVGAVRPAGAVPPAGTARPAPPPSSPARAATNNFQI